jgi:hypothetical protein
MKKGRIDYPIVLILAIRVIYCYDLGLQNKRSLEHRFLRTRDLKNDRSKD